MAETIPPQLTLNLPPEYELKLLTALSFFLGRHLEAQALACLSMYLRQAEPRIMAQVRYYAHQASQNSGAVMSEYELLDLIFTQPDRARSLLPQVTGVHHPEDGQDVFEPRSSYSS